jgi:dTMP kinase
MMFFITFEGIEGSGKTTQNQRLAEFLIAAGHQVVQTREPGGTEIGYKLRQLILNNNTHFADPHSEVLLFYADRLEHVASVIKPALKASKMVICDRYIDSTIAYQKGGRNMPERLINGLDAFIDLMPDLTMLLDISPEEGLRRATKRAALDRFEQEELAFHHRVREGYLAQAKKEPERIKKIGVEGLNPEEVFERVKQITVQFLEEKNK